MSHTLADLAILAGGKVIGDSSVIIESAKPLNEARLRDITFVDNPKLIETAIYSQATAFIVNENTHRKMEQSRNENSTSVSFIISDNPIASFIKVVQYFKGSRTRINMGIHADASVDPQVQVGSQTNIYPGTFIDEGTIIGNRCTIHSGVRIGHTVHIGDDVTLYPNVVIYPEMILGNRIFCITAFSVSDALLDPNPVHSMKDVPYELPTEFEVGAILERENPFDAFVSNDLLKKILLE